MGLLICKRQLQTLSTPTSTQPAQALSFSTWEHLLCHALSFCPLASQILSFQKHHLHTPSLSVLLNSPFFLLLPCTHSFVSPPPTTDKITRSGFQPVLCKDLAQSFVSFSIHGMCLKHHGELHYTVKRKQHSHASTRTHRKKNPESKMQPKYKSL